MASLTFTGMPNAPQGASYSAPLLNFAPIGELVGDYVKGTQAKQQLDVQRAFRAGIPKDAGGNPDYGAMANRMYELGDIGKGNDLSNIGIQRQQLLMGEQVARGAGGLPGLPGQSGEAPAPVAPGMSPAAAPRPAAPRSAAAGPPAGDAGAGDNGRTTVTAIVSGQMPEELAGPVINRVAARIGVDPNQPLDERGIAMVGRALLAEGIGRPTVGSPQSGGAPAAAPQQPGASAPAQSPQIAPQAAAAAEQRMATMSPEQRIQWLSRVAASPMMPQSVKDWASKRLEAEYKAVEPTPGQREYGADRRAGESQSAYEARRAGEKKQAEVNAENTGLTPEEKQYQRDRQPGETLAAYQARVAGGKKTAEVGAENEALTPQQKNARASSMTPLQLQQAEERQKEQTTRYGKVYEGLQKGADEAENLVSSLKLTKSLMADPNFYSGVGEEYNLLWKRIKASMGIAPNEALPQEAFRKAVSASILDQIRSLGGQGLGQVRVAEINVMKSAAQNQDNTPAANRLLTELMLRTAERWTIPIANLSRDYVQQHGALDAGFDKLKADWMNKHPLLGDDELADTRRIAPPIVKTPADLKRYHWRPGEPFSTTDGRIFTQAPEGWR